MADFKKYCEDCFRPAPPEWNRRYCPECGGRLKLELVKRRRGSQGRSRAPGAEAEEPARERRPRLTVSRRLLKPKRFGIFAARGRSALGPRFPAMSPALLFILNAVTAGLRSTFWVINRMPSLMMIAKPEEKNISLCAMTWGASFCAHFILSVLLIFSAIANWPDVERLAPPQLICGEAAVFAVSFIMNRFILYWCREVIVDGLSASGLDAIRARAHTFAPSPMMIWFLGVPYIQSHINRMIKKKGLSTYNSRRTQQWQSSDADAGNYTFISA